VSEVVSEVEMEVVIEGREAEADAEVEVEPAVLIEDARDGAGLG
jgi:hypothetical protein